MSLTELLVGAVLLGVSLSVVAELMTLCVYANTTLFRQFDAQMNVSVALDRIKREVRSAYQIPSGLTDSEALEFGQKKFLNSQTLILREPIYFFGKVNDPQDPAYDSSAASAIGTGFQLPGYYLVVYEVAPDATRSGEFVLQMTRKRMPNEETYRNRFPTLSDKNSFLSNVDKQVIATGLVGPFEDTSKSGYPKIFGFTSRNPNGGRLDLLKEGYVVQDGVALGINGVSIDIEVRRGEVDSQKHEQIVATHTESYLRNHDFSLGSIDVNAFE